MKKRKLQINLSNKTFYTLILIGALILFGVGVYAVAGVSHSTGEIEFDTNAACGLICKDANTDTQDLSISGSTLSLTDGGSVPLPGGGDSDWIISGDDVYRAGDVIIGRSGRLTAGSKLYIGDTGDYDYVISADMMPRDTGRIAIYGKASGPYGPYGIGVYGSGGEIGVKGYTSNQDGYSGYFTGGKGLYTDHLTVSGDLKATSNLHGASTDVLLEDDNDGAIWYTCPPGMFVCGVLYFDSSKTNSNNRVRELRCCYL